MAMSCKTPGKILLSIVYVAGVLLASKVCLAEAATAYPPLASFEVWRTPPFQASFIPVNDGGRFDDNSSVAFIARNHVLIIADDDRLLRAMRLLRLEGQSRYSVALAKLAERQRPSSQTPEVLYELALAYFTLEDCKTVRRLLAQFTEDDYASNTTSNAASGEGEVGEGLEFLGEACRLRERVRFEWETATSFGYDSNLANTRDRHTVILEKGSQLRNYIDGVLGTLDISLNQIFLGTEKVGGWFAEQNLRASIKRQVNRRHNRIDVGGFYRSTQPLGYDRKGAHFNLGWHTPLGSTETKSVLFENRLTAQTFNQGQGRHRPSLTQNSLRLAQSLYMRPVAIMTAIIQAHAKTSSSPRIPASAVDEFGGRITLIASNPNHTPTHADTGTGTGTISTLKGWRIGMYHTSRHAVQPHNSVTVYGLDGEVHFGRTRHYVVKFGRGHEHLAAPRPWAVGAHTITHVYAGLGLYPFGEDSPWRVDGQWNHSTSPDAHDRQSDWQVVAHYEWN